MIDKWTVIAILISLGYFILSYFAIKLLIKRTKNLPHNLRLIITSAAYSFIFGIGIIGSGGEPGFAFPFLISIASIVGIIYWIPLTIYMYYI